MLEETDQPILKTQPVALITGVTGQDGAYLADFLLQKGYKVFGIKRRSSLINTLRVDHLYTNPNFKMVYGDLTDSLNLVKIISETQPDEIYNLGAMSHVAVSFEMPEYTANTDALGALRILEALKILGLTKTKYYQASTSELYGKVLETPQTEKTPFYPRSPYAIAKQFAFSTTVNYREQGFFACNGILFNHESPTRGETFVTRKIVRGIINQLLGKSECLYLGNLNAQRDWGHARDFVEGMWLMLQQDKPDDYVLATGQLTSVRTFVQKVCTALNIQIEFTGVLSHEKAIVVNDNNSRGFYPQFKQLKTGHELVRISEKYFRPTEVDLLLGDATKAKNILGWEPKSTIDEMIKEMIEYDLKDLAK